MWLFRAATHTNKRTAEPTVLTNDNDHNNKEKHDNEKHPTGLAIPDGLPVAATGLAIIIIILGGSPGRDCGWHQHSRARVW